MDNIAEFSLSAFSMALGLSLAICPNVYTQNGLVESFIQRVKLIALSLLWNCNLPTLRWHHAVLHAHDKTA